MHKFLLPDFVALLHDFADSEDEAQMDIAQWDTYTYKTETIEYLGCR